MSGWTDHLGEFAEGVLNTVLLTVFSTLGAVLVALVITAFRICPVRPLRAFGTGYVELFQNIPLAVWLVLFVFGLPMVGISFELFPTAVLATALYMASYYAETLRSGINAVSSGQAEAARALGLGFGQSLRAVILPQALRTIIQPLGNVTIQLLMNTALAAAVGVVELTEATNRVNLVLAEPLPLYVGAGVCYAVLAMVISSGAGVLERKLVIPR
ncbi:amino acid ABC transporter permease [Amycolatopsis thermophila]|uniref:Glutamate transport system permease protein n=1 Tax=Amycolatopsis thermophila TaxID=206084 RepID=A0ABU0EVQ4_9PSEU|nr:amino acid ABC transporter permease [Amycolatopsis thermophila]MDQ0378892.1 glutamate transport system permease protein [Amycolatopsis thermophila]